MSEDKQTFTDPHTGEEMESTWLARSGAWVMTAGVIGLVMGLAWGLIFGLAELIFGLLIGVITMIGFIIHYNIAEMPNMRFNQHNWKLHN